LKHTGFLPILGIGSSASAWDYKYKKRKKTMKKSTRKENINFLLENWDFLNMKEIRKLYAHRRVF